jgi:hypothetical protein
MELEPATYSVYELDENGKTGAMEASYDTVAEVLAHCEEGLKDYAIKVEGRTLSLEDFLENYAAAG